MRIIESWLAFCIFVSIWAKWKRGKNPFLWFLISIVISPIGAYIALAFVEDETESSGEEENLNGDTETPNTKNSRPSGFNPDEHEKRCPMCAEYIKLEARRCKHCGHEFPEEEVEKQIEEERREFEEDGASEGDRYCERHRTWIIPDGVECPECGWGIEDGRHPPSEEPKKGAKERRICPTCETPSPLDQTECPRCGTDLKE